MLQELHFVELWGMGEQCQMDTQGVKARGRISSLGARQLYPKL
jgi:hypothetical protein